MRNFVVALTRNPISLAGVAIASASAVIILSLIGVELIGSHGSPYIGILAYLVLPGIFIFALLLIPLGIVRDRRRTRQALAGGGSEPSFPVIDLNNDRVRRNLLIFLVLTAVNVVILASATFKGVEVMDSTTFCAETCHVMEPERTAYARSPHSRVKCVECHIGPGAGWFVKSKLSGAWQVVSTNLKLYPRPVPTPVHNLRPARDTCEQCHWPSKFVGDRLQVIPHYANDDANTESKSVLVMHVGGHTGPEAHGIHWHVDPGVQIRYRSDETRETIYDVELTEPDGTVTLFEGAEPADSDGLDEPQDWRVMDCVDCHNRPTHVFRLPDSEIDVALSDERIDRTLPFVRREGLRLLREEYASHDEARERIARGLVSYYEESHPELAAERGEAIRLAADQLGDLWCSNVFPQMNVGWGSYPDHIGHMNSPGCFRCHDDEHTSSDGRTIAQDCGSCHTILAMEEEDPEVLQMLGG